MPSDTSILAKNLTVTYGQTVALQNITCATTGKITAVIGHNGSGKSTLMKSILRLLPARIGAINVLQENDELIPERDMAFSPEHGAVFADIKVESYVRLWCRIRCRPSFDFLRDGSSYLERLEITPLLSKLGRSLSKGQRQRVQTFIGFLLNPRLFVFDEPFDGLDVMQTRNFSQLMAEEALIRGILLSSHRMDVVERLADQIIVLREGVCFAAGTVAEVKRTLCGNGISVLVPHLNEEQLGSLRMTLAIKLPQTLVTRVGRELAIVGHGIDLAMVENILRTHGIDNATVTCGEPSLVDAMDFHLRSLRSLKDNESVNLTKINCGEEIALTFL